MAAEELKTWILGIEPTATFDETGEWLVVQISPDQWSTLSTALRKGPPAMDFVLPVLIGKHTSPWCIMYAAAEQMIQWW
jgi:hypothetical protein